MDTNMILDTGNTAWMIVATLLVLLMTIPGIALFYGGLVRQKNVLSIIMQCMLIVCAVTIIWVAFGYSFVFGTSLMDSGSAWSFLIGGFDKVLLKGITTSSLSTGNIPEIIFVLFQCMFAIITPALILGAFAERLKFSGFLIFTVLWSILVYIPMALGMGRRISPADGCDRLCRRNRSTYQCRYFGSRNGYYGRKEK